MLRYVCMAILLTALAPFIVLMVVLGSLLRAWDWAIGELAASDID